MPKAIKIIVAYAGRFQPPGAHHAAVYQNLVKKFGKDYVYVATSNVTDRTRSPLSFQWKQKLISQLFGCPQNRVLKISDPYGYKDYLKAFSSKEGELKIVFAVGEKDTGRLSPKYFTRFGSNSSLKDLLKTPKDQNLFYYINPNVTMSGKVMSSTDIRALIRKPKLNQKDFETLEKMTGMKRQQVLLVKPLFEACHANQIRLLTEGGSAGHMSHIFEDLSLTFEDLRKIVANSLQGHLDKEEVPTLKVDGQNLFATVVGKTVKYARNKTQIRDMGKNALTASDIAGMWADIPNVRNAFMTAAKDLEGSLGSLSDSFKERLFANGKKWINFEIVFSETRNVINYDGDYIVFHNLQTVNEKGEKIAVDGEAVGRLYKALEKAQSTVQSKFRISPPVSVKVSKDQDFSEKFKDFNAEISQIQKTYKMSNSSTLGDYLSAAFDAELKKVEGKTSTNVPSALRSRLVRRLAYGDKALTLTQISSSVNDPALFKAIKDLDSSSVELSKKFMWPIERLIIRLGVVVLQNLQTYLSANPTEVAEKLRSQVTSQIAKIKGSNNPADIDKMRELLKKIDSAGGMKSLSAEEGLVFKYKGKYFKLTGSFGAVNQLLGIGRY